ncbi:MAG: hypothetical protein AAFV93_05000 [Chloroflexota bacterium]
MLDETLQITMVTDTLKQYYLNDGQIIGYEPIGVRRETVNAWKENTLTMAQNWHTGQAYHEIHDMRQSSITPYARQKALELTQALGDIEGRAAVVIAPSQTGLVIQFFVNHVFNRFNTHRERKVFTNFDDAVAWVREALN